MCLPDFEPSFNMLTTGLRSLGMGIDNWIDVASIIIQKTIGITDVPTCKALALGFGPQNNVTALFEKKQTIVVGLTEGLYAGTIALYSCTCLTLLTLSHPHTLTPQNLNPASHS
jgi:hypothetical protein